MRALRPLTLRALALALALAATGCMTRAEGDAVKADVEALKKQLAEQATKAEIERAKLQKVMEQATGLLTRNNADVGVQVERMQTRLDRIGGDVEERLKKVDDLDKKFSDFKAKVDIKLEGLSGSSPQAKNPATPTDKDELFRQAAAKLAAGDHPEARRLARSFLERFPSDPRVDRAQLMLGDSYYAEQKFAPAIVEYKKVIEQYPKSAQVPEALNKVGMSFYQLKYCSDAELFFSQLAKKYKKTPQAANATRVLGLIKKYKKNREICRP